MDQIFKIIEMVMNFTASKSQTMSKQLLSTLRKMILLVVVALGSMALFCVGVSLAVTNLAQQFDGQADAITFNGSVVIGSLLAIISLAVFFYCLGQKAWLKAANAQIERKNSTASPIEEALAFFIKDLVVERHAKRQPAQETVNPES